MLSARGWAGKINFCAEWSTGLIAVYGEIALAASGEGFVGTFENRIFCVRFVGFGKSESIGWKRSFSVTSIIAHFNFSDFIG